MKLKLPTLILTLLLILTLVPAAFAQVEDDEVSDFCLDKSTYLHPEEGFQHPVGSRIALRYEVEYPVVMSWFCQGFGFGQIMLALETSKVMDTDENEEFDLQKYAESLLLTRKSEQVGWGQIWKDLGFIGRPKGDDWAGGPPKWAGPNHTDDEEGEGFGPPPWAGPPEWAGQDHTDDEEGEGFGPPSWAGPKDKDRSPGPPPWAGPKFKPPTP
jgi:hypothetical protein